MGSGILLAPEGVAAPGPPGPSGREGAGLVDIDFTALTALSSWALVTGTLAVLYWQTRQAQQLHSANTVLTLRERFDSPRMRRARVHLSSRLLNSGQDDISNVEVATFFELVGSLTRRKVLDLDMVWEAFGGWVTNYWWALRNPVDLIGNIRVATRDPLVFYSFEWLNLRVLELDRRMLGPAHAQLAPQSEEAAAALRRESKLDLEIS